MAETIIVPGVGQIKLVDRDQLRFRTHGRKFSVPYHLQGLLSTIPTPPESFDWSNGEKIIFPMLGNDQYGDCYECSPLHQIQSFTGMNGTQAQFDRSSVVNRYLQLSGGDNGLDDSVVYPEWKHGNLGPNGPHKILDEITVNPADIASLDLGLWAYGGSQWTCSLPSGWANNARPGAVWDAGQGRSVGGHAMFLSGKKNGRYQTRTWGIAPPPEVTHAGIMSAESEIILVFAMELFNASGYAPCGLHYTTLAPLWHTLGGVKLPDSPFPAPGPAPTPTPPGPTPIPPTPAPGPHTMTRILPIGTKGQVTIQIDYSGAINAVRIV